MTISSKHLTKKKNRSLDVNKLPFKTTDGEPSNVSTFKMNPTTGERPLKFDRRYSRRLGAKYVSGGGREHNILQDGHLFRIQPFMGGRVALSIRGQFTSFKAAEIALVAYLLSKEKPWKLAVVPKEYRVG